MLASSGRYTSTCEPKRIKAKAMTARQHVPSLDVAKDARAIRSATSTEVVSVPSGDNTALAKNVQPGRWTDEGNFHWRLGYKN
jgi:hypothetical protein